MRTSILRRILAVVLIVSAGCSKKAPGHVSSTPSALVDPSKDVEVQQSVHVFLDEFDGDGTESYGGLDYLRIESGGRVFPLYLTEDNGQLFSVDYWLDHIQPYNHVGVNRFGDFKLGISYKNLPAEEQRVVQAFCRQGVKVYDRVILVHPASPDGCEAAVFDLAKMVSACGR